MMSADEARSRGLGAARGCVVALCGYVVLAAFLYLAWQLWRAVAG